MKIFSRFKFLVIFIFSILLVIVVLLEKEKTENVISAQVPQASEETGTYLSNILQACETEYQWSAVVMDAQSGAVLDSYGDINTSYEPSSTFKAIPAAILLEKEKIALSDIFIGNPYEYEDNKTIRSFNNQDGEKTFSEHFINLNEPLMLRAWNEKGGDLDFLEEVKSFLTPLRFLPENKSTQLYLLGNGFEVTLLDMAKAYSHLAGNERNASKKFISQETSEKIRKLLHETYQNYSNIEPELVSIQDIGEIAGLYGSTYSLENENTQVTASFAGFAPYDDPQIIIVMTMTQKGALEEIAKDKTVLANMSTQAFQYYLPKRYFQEISEINFGNDDIEYLVFAGRPTCGPCQYVEPIIRKKANDLQKDVFYLNTDKLKNDDAQEIFNTYKIDEVPCLLKIKNGKTTEVILFTGESDLENYISGLLS